MVVISTGASIFLVSASKLWRLLDTVELEDLPDSRERTRAPVLWLSCGGQTDVWELYSDNSYLSATLDRQGFSVTDPVDLRTKNTESFLPQLLQDFWSKLKEKNPKIVVMSPTTTSLNSKQKEVKPFKERLRHRKIWEMLSREKALFRTYKKMTTRIS